MHARSRICELPFAVDQSEAVGLSELKMKPLACLLMLVLLNDFATNLPTYIPTRADRTPTLPARGSASRLWEAS